MTTIQTRTEEIYAELKLVDRMTPGRTPWQTLRKRAAEVAATETVTEADRLPLMDANSSNPLEASIARLRGDWDADGTVSVHLPTDVAEQLLAARGWRRGAGPSWTSPAGHVFWERSEALAVALIAEVS